MKCGRFIEWRKDDGDGAKKPRELSSENGSSRSRLSVSAEPATPAPSSVVTVQEELGSPDEWLYVSKRLDLQWLPNTPLWSAVAVSLGDRVFYRLSARVLVWLEKAGEQLEQQCLAGAVARDQLNAYLEAMGVVWAFAGEHLARQAIQVAKVNTVSLPDAPQVK